MWQPARANASRSEQTTHRPTLDHGHDRLESHRAPLAAHGRPRSAVPTHGRAWPPCSAQTWQATHCYAAVAPALVPAPVPAPAAAPGCSKQRRRTSQASALPHTTPLTRPILGSLFKRGKMGVRVPFLTPSVDSLATRRQACVARSSSAAAAAWRSASNANVSVAKRAW